MRGNNYHFSRSFISASGSPPLAREQLSASLTSRSLRRITPACAGTTQGQTGQCRCNEDHPRLRGNNFRKHAHSWPHLGSPPLAREQLYDAFQNGTLARITPACAGTTCPRRGCVISVRDHPRLRGNNLNILPFASSVSGSPPLAREQLSFQQIIYFCIRITPACAGTTSPSYSWLCQRQDHPRLRGNNCS